MPPRLRTVDALETLQLSWGGLFDGRPADNYAVHLSDPETGRVSMCGVDLFAKDGPGFSRGGGLSGESIVHTPCDACADAARERFPGLPVRGSVGGRQMAAHLDVEYLQ